MTPILAADKIAFAYPERPELFLDLSFALRDRERIGLCGPNGSGKTTLLRIVMGLEKPRSGAIFHRGEAVTNADSLGRMRRAVGYVMQNTDDQLFSATVLEEVAFGPLNLGLKRREARSRALETLDGMGLAALAERATHRLSVGEKKMVALASVLSMRPDALLLDEPTASLDESARDRLAGVLQRQNAALLIVSHDPEFLRQTTASLMRLDATGKLS